MRRIITMLLIMPVIGLWMLACSKKDQEPRAVAPVQEATAFDGKPLYRKQVDADQLEAADKQIEAIRKKPVLTETDSIELGSLYTATYRLKEATNVYEEGIRQYPDAYRLHRHKGHRHLSLRELNPAIVHLSRADQLIGPQDNGDLEYDAAGQPTGTYKYWVKYYSGVYYMLTDDLNNAIKSYQSCLDLAIDKKNTVGPSAWLYHLHQMKGRPEQAQSIIDKIAKDLDTDQSHPYFKQAMLFRGVVTPASLLAERPADATDWTVQDATVSFGVARYQLYQRDTVGYRNLIEQILQTEHWNAWAYVLAEKDKMGWRRK